MSGLSPGVVLFIADGGGGHLYVVITRESAPECVVVNFSTPRRFKEATCTVEPKECEFLTHTSVIEYGRAKVVPVHALDSAIGGGAVVYRGRVTDELLGRILDGAAASSFLPADAKALLESQGLI